MKKLILLFPLLIILCSCAPKRYSAQYFDYFDTVITLDGYFDTKMDFDKACEITEATLKEYDAIFDIYDDGEAKRLNEEKELSVSEELYEAIDFGKKVYDLTDGKCNIAMGAVLSLWHEAREAEGAYLPSDDALTLASRHTDPSDIVMESGKVTLLNENMTLDFGAIAKGCVSDVLRERLTSEGLDNMFVNLGGNVMVIGDKDGEGWNVGVQSTFDSSEICYAKKIKDKCLVTSGVYQRYFEYEGVKYHHIISPDTLYPSDRYLSVSILSDSGALADALSTALFNMTVEEGKEVLEKLDDIGAMWILSNGEKVFYGNLD